ncbi:hypothetical protein JX266_005685 [Neoarthrinium moseri]|nr:hypothetical protein JX266_005685 [Neoarthrinium moseri]
MAAGLFSLSRAQDGPSSGRQRARKPVVADHTEFYGSQVGGQSVINYGYTDMPLKLLIWDIRTFFTFAWALPWVVWPIRPIDGGEFDELSFTPSNLYCLFIHGVLIALQLGFILLLPLAILLPGEMWMKRNIDRLALTFKRPVEGIHNKTTGIIFDVVECLIQRNFGYATSDVRIAYKTVKEHLYNPSLSKVVFILHSQGGIEGGLVLDWLLQELPQDLLAKLEVYTFGCAANHFNNPHRHVGSQAAQSQPPGTISTTTTHVVQTVITDSPVDMRIPSLSQSPTGDARQPSQSADDPPTPTSLPGQGQAPRPITTVPAADRAIGHIEHYAHTTDFVALWGVLHFVTNEMASPMLPRFIGRVFSRTSSRGGHQFCQHYLDGMFPLEKNSAGEFIGCKENNDFMDSIAEKAKRGTEQEDLREGIENSWDMIELAGREGSELDSDVAVHGSFHEGRLLNREVRVKDLSRLWLYRNGKSPPELPSAIKPDVGGVVRAETL